MKQQLGMMLGLSALMMGSAMAQQQAQQQPTPQQIANRAAAKTVLQAADKAMGASFVKGWTASGTGWMGYPGQQFAQGDLPRTDAKNFVETVDLASKSGSWQWTRVQGNNAIRGGGAGFPVQGEANFKEYVNGAVAWNVNPQGQAARSNQREAGDRQLRLWLNPAKIGRAHV